MKNMETIATILVFIAMLSVLVILHELGHFLTAKKFGIKVEEFGFGLPPRIFGIKRGETIYSINWLPIGGFVKLYGEDMEPGEKAPKSMVARAFYSRPIWQRAIVLCAGVFMNFVLSVIIVTFLFTQGVMVPSGQVRIESISVSSPAEKAGLRIGDIVTEIKAGSDDIHITQSEELGPAVKKYLGKEITVVILRNGETLSVVLTPRKDYPAGEGPMGVAIDDHVKKYYSITEAPVAGIKESVSRTVEIVKGISQTFVKFFIQRKSVGDEVAGPLKIGQMTGEVRKLGFLPFLDFMGLISLNLAIINILPFPALDGGRFLFVVLEAIFGRKVKPAFERYAHLVGMAILLILILLISVNDVIRLVAGK